MLLRWSSPRADLLLTHRQIAQLGASETSEDDLHPRTHATLSSGKNFPIRKSADKRRGF
jgi:hypothetical protein